MVPPSPIIKEVFNTVGFGNIRKRGVRQELMQVTHKDTEESELIGR